MKASQTAKFALIAAVIALWRSMQNQTTLTGQTAVAPALYPGDTILRVNFADSRVAGAAGIKGANYTMTDFATTFVSTREFGQATALRNYTRLGLRGWVDQVPASGLSSFQDFLMLHLGGPGVVVVMPAPFVVDFAPTGPAAGVFDTGLIPIVDSGLAPLGVPLKKLAAGVDQVMLGSTWVINAADSPAVLTGYIEVYGAV